MVSDEFIMPFGKYKGEKIANVTANYLLHLYDNGIAKWMVKFYIEENMEILRKEVENER